MAEFELTADQHKALRALLQVDEAELRANIKMMSDGEAALEPLKDRLENTKEIFFSSNDCRAAYWLHVSARALNTAIRSLKKTPDFEGLNERDVCAALVAFLLEEQLVQNWHGRRRMA